MPDDATIDRYGPVALVTGASSGIGRAFAEELAARGLDLVLVARRVERLEELAAALAEQHGIRATVCRADLSDADALATIARATEGLDVGLVVSNAGFGLKGPYESHEAQRLTDMLMVNCHAPMRLAHHFVPRLCRRGRGGILFTSSVEGLMGLPYSTAYAATKALVNSLAEGLWGELSPEGIDVLALCPGATDTEAPRLQGIDPATLTDVMSPAEVAKRALENLRNGPVYVCSEPYKARFEQLTALPRRDALMAAAMAMKGS
jgi:uncharacterized protein